MKTIKCTKNLINDMGEKDFTKGKEYSVVNNANGNFVNVCDSILTIDDLGQLHRLGIWHTYFKKVN